MYIYLSEQRSLSLRGAELQLQSTEFKFDKPPPISHVNCAGAGDKASGVGSMGDLPPRREFNPPDEEIIREYLTRKKNEAAFHSNMIHTVDFYDFGPDFLSGIHNASGDRVWYYFTKRKRSNRPTHVVDRRAGDGFWRVVGAVKRITHGGRRIGVRRPFAYFTGTHQNSVRTDWLMQEFTGPETRVRIDDWVVCKMYKSTSKKGSSSSTSDGVNEAGSSRKRNRDGKVKDGKANSNTARPEAIQTSCG